MINTNCLFCKHYYGGWMCKAFPDKIPNEIQLDQVNHRKPYKGDHDIQFEPIEENELSDIDFMVKNWTIGNPKIFDKVKQ